ncbi:unnamed protein product [Rotaria sp. Silwood2]|nr:unnamed protein product [Rotaria sp. Silwood2]CAF4393352.1 unnamed protein product [Rotaria sp. Silwood2]
MSNSTNRSVKISLDVLQASIILPMMDKYMLIVLYIGGMLGSLLNIFTFRQRKFRKNSCSLYFLSASITDFFVMNAVLMMDALRYLNSSLFNLINSSRIGCKLGKYLIYLLPCLSSTFITLACIDRFCTSSYNSRLRKLSQLKVSRILISLVVLISVVFSIHITFLFDILPPTPAKSDPCRSPSNVFQLSLIIDGYFFSMYNGAIVPLLLLIFGLLIHRNVRLSRRRIAATSNITSNRTIIATRNPNLNRHNLHLITMLLIQSIVTVILNIPYMTVALYGFYNNAPTDQMLLLLYIIFVYIARWFWFSNYVKTFYINTLSSEIFRNTLIQLFIDISDQMRVRIQQ